MQVILGELQFGDMKLEKVMIMIEQLCDRWGFDFHIEGVGDGERMYIFEKGGLIGWN